MWILLLCLVTQALACGFPGAPAHSLLSFSAESVSTGTIATYKCEPGFQLLGPARRLCVDNGTWIPPGAPICVMNVALDKASMQSSVFQKGIPQKAVDGSTSRLFSPDTCTQTESEKSPWWYVNLLEPFMVQLLRIDFGKSCCEHNRPARIVVRVGNNRPDIGVNPVCNRFAGRIEEGRTLYLPCTAPMVGVFVSVHLEGTTQVDLSICEAFVYTDQALPVEQCPSFPDQPEGGGATYNGKCYMFYNTGPRTFESARRFCELRGGSLIDESNPALQGFLSWELYKRHRKDRDGDYWMGAVRDPLNKKNWKWINGQEVGVSFWNVPPGQQNCSRYEGSKGWLWSDVDCQSQLNFICQHKPVTCGSPDRPTNSTVLSRNTDVDSEVDYRCAPGHLLEGPRIRTCLGTGFYSGFPPKCTYVECGYPATIPNGGYNLLNGTRYFLSRVEYFCVEGYVLVGRGVLTCDVDHKWNGPPPRCDNLLCHTPPGINHGNVTLLSNTSFQGTVAEYACLQGYRLEGSSRITCGPEGFWDKEPPVCEHGSYIVTVKPDGRPDWSRGSKRGKNTVTARINMGGIIALGVFGGFVFLAVVISIIVIIVRSTSTMEKLRLRSRWTLRRCPRGAGCQTLHK